MRIFVTGGFGFTGRNLTQCATALGYEVYASSSNLLDKHRLFEEMEIFSPDFVLHLAGISFAQHGPISDFFDVNVRGTQNLLDAVVRLRAKPKRVVLASSASVYGNVDVSPVTEVTPLNPVNAYGESKAQMEEMAMAYSGDLSIIITRPFNYTGVGQSTNFLIPKIVDHFVRADIRIKLGNINIEREFNDVRFVSSVYLELLQTAAEFEIYNICTGCVFSINKIFAILHRLTGHLVNIEFDQHLYRKNEVRIFYGNPEKLRRTIKSPREYSIDQTLEWMIKAS